MLELTISRVGFWLLGLSQLASLTHGVPASPFQNDDASQITKTWLSTESEFPEATDPNALGMACADQRQTLEEFFFYRNLPFRKDLVRALRGRQCHVYYEPSLPGFRASPDDYPIQKLLFSVDSLQFLRHSAHGKTEALGVIESVLSRIRAPLQVEIGFPHNLSPITYEAARGQHFGHLSHDVALDDQGTGGPSMHWTQDLFKSGYHRGQPVLLVPHQLFEGEVEVAERFEALIGRISKRAWVTRSKLSWEGGDLQFALDPEDTSKVILFYGAKAKSYWGNALTPSEYEYVLSLEFGADRAVDLSGFAPHVDYFAAFLQGGVVLMSEPASGGVRLARTALKRLLEKFGSASPGVLLEIDRLLQASPADISTILDLLDRARLEKLQWRIGIDARFSQDLQSLVGTICPDRDSCFEPGNQLALLEEDPELFGQWIREARRLSWWLEMVEAYLTLIESALVEPPLEEIEAIDAKVREIEALGYRVIRIPRLGLVRRIEGGWPGIAYVNGLVVGNQVFIPQFGLGEYEKEIFSSLQGKLGDSYEVVPVPAEDVLVRNGGIHCLAAIVRHAGQNPSQLRSATSNRQTTSTPR